MTSITTNLNERSAGTDVFVRDCYGDTILHCDSGSGQGAGTVKSYLTVAPGRTEQNVSLSTTSSQTNATLEINGKGTGGILAEGVTLYNGTISFDNGTASWTLTPAVLSNTTEVSFASTSVYSQLGKVVCWHVEISGFTTNLAGTTASVTFQLPFATLGSVTNYAIGSGRATNGFEIVPAICYTTSSDRSEAIAFFIFPSGSGDGVATSFSVGGTYIAA